VPSHAIPAAYPADRLGFGDSGLQTLADELNSRVTAIHPDLRWEFARGTRSRHALVVSPGGNPRVRVAAARWYAEAPAPDEDWEYHRCRQADPDALAATIGIGGERLDLSELRFTVAHLS